jgi:TRAP-type C4-dicarboxylate transport system permease small subunit
MKKIKNILVGFLVSFIGSIPLGYLNLAGLEIYSKFGLHNLIFFLLGVVLVETFVIYFTLLFAKQLVNNKKLMKIIDFFAVVFMFVLAYLFYSYSNQPATSKSNIDQFLMYSPFVIGVILNCFNFLQLPFWTSWNLYLVNGKYITTEKQLKYYYIAGTLTGVFFGMLTLIVLLQSIFQKANEFSKYIMPVFIPLFFVLLGGIQVFKVYKKYFKSSSLAL